MQTHHLEEVQIINKWIVTFFGGFGKIKFYRDDVVYDTAVILETMPEADALIKALHYASLSPNYQKQKSFINWNVIHLPPELSPADAEDIPPEVISNFDSLNINHIREDLHWTLRQEGLKKFKEKAQKKSELDAVINLYALASLFKGSMIGFDIGHQFTAYYPEEIGDITDPYYKARCLFHLHSLNTGNYANSAQAKTILYSTIRQISDPHRQVRIWELCFALVPSGDFAEIIAEIKTKIDEIEDAENRARAYGRIALLLPAEWSKDWFRHMFKAVPFIPDDYRKAQTLQEIHRILPNDDELVNLMEEAGNQITDSWLKAKSFDRLTDELAIHPPPEITDLIEADKELWAPVLLSGTIGSALRQFRSEASIELVWKEFAETHSQESFDGILKFGLESDRLVLSYNAAQAVESLMEGFTVKQIYKRRLHQLLPLLVDSTVQTLPFISNWKDNSDPFVVGHATLLSLENGKKISAEDVDPLLFLLESDSDLSRLRAYLAFASNVWNVEKERFITLKTVGKELVEKIATELYHTAHSGHFKRLALLNFFSNIIHDDNEALVAWATRGSKVDNLILQNIEVVANDSLEVYCGLFTNDLSNDSKESLFVSNCRLATLKQQHQTNLSHLAALNKDFEFRHTYFEDIFSTIGHCLNEIFGEESFDVNLAKSQLKEKVEKKAVTVAALSFNAVSSGIGGSFYRNLDGVDEEAVQLAQQIVNRSEKKEETENKTRIIYEWLFDEINREDGNLVIQGALIRLLAEISRLAPSSILILNKENPISNLLLDQIDKYSAVWERRGCLVLIGCFGRLNGRTLDLYLRQSREDRDIWTSTIDNIHKVSFIEVNTLDDMLSQLFGELENQSAIRAYFASRILVAIGKNNNVNTNQKRRILKRITDASQGILANRNVYLFKGSGKDKDNVVSIRKLISLEKAFNQAIVEIIGLS